MAGTASVGGIVSGIDVDAIITKLSALEQKAVTQYQDQQTKLKSKQSAFQDINTRLAALNTAATSLSSATFFNKRLVTTDTTAVTATAGSGATPGEYQIAVGTVARAHQVLSQSYSDINVSRLGTGTFTVTSAGQATTITLDSSNNTIGGLRDAINAANSNVRASIVQDGDSSYRLMIASKNSGTTNALTISSSLSGGTDPSFSTLQTAENATVTLGSGASAISITRSSNTITDLIPGVTMNLQAAAAGKTVSVSVGMDTEAISAGVKDFVDQYNNVLDTINTQFTYTGAGSSGGALIGDFTLQRIQTQIRDISSNAVSGVTGSYNSLADVGITTGADGKLTYKAETFTDKIMSDPESVTRLFALTGRSSNAAVQFLGATAKTSASGTAYSVNITQAARQARVTAGVAQTGTLASDEVLTINGVSVALTSGMTQTETVAAINARSNQTGVSVRATAADGTGTGNYLSFFSTAYGSTAGVTVSSSVSNSGGDSSGVGNVQATHTSPTGEGGTGTGVTGLDVMGTINGETATGRGRTLVGNVGNANTEGLRLQVASDVTGTLGTVQVFGGASYNAARVLTEITDKTTGSIQTEQDTLTNQILDLQKTIDKRNAEVTAHAASLRAKFNQMESLMGQLNSTGSYLTSQFAAMNKSSSS